MILPDTSVWVEHIRSSNPRLEEFLLDSQIFVHPFVIGEIACGNLRDRAQVLGFFGDLPCAVMAAHSEALRLVEEHRLWGRGITWIDVHLLASSLLTGCRLWTLDRPLREAARKLNVEYA